VASASEFDLLVEDCDGLCPWTFQPQLNVDGRVATETVEYAVAKVETALHHAPAPVLRVRLCLRQSVCAAATGRPQARVDVDLNGCTSVPMPSVERPG
jgi:hypothetical protein